MHNNAESRASEGMHGSDKPTGKVWHFIMLFMAYRQETLSALAMIGCIIVAEVAL